MPWVGSIIPGSLLGTAEAARRAQRKRDERREAAESGTFERLLDRAELSVDRVQPTNRTEHVKLVATEEGREDHQRNVDAAAPVERPDAAQRRRVDLEG